MWYKNVGTSFFSFVTEHAFDRQTDRQTGRKASAIPCHALHAVARQNASLFDKYEKASYVYQRLTFNEQQHLRFGLITCSICRKSPIFAL